MADPMQVSSELELEVEAIRQNTVSKESRRLYLRSTTRCLLWIFENHRNLVTSAFEDALLNCRNLNERKKAIEAFLMNKSNCSPIKFGMITAPLFVSWLSLIHI